LDFSPLVRKRRARSSLGFTLIELMVVVVIIGILASLGVPTIVERLRERRANQAAQEIALLYRNARLRALGQGFAVLVSYNAATGFEVHEAMPFGGVTGGCNLQMPLSCTTNTWAAAGTDYRVIGGFYATAYPDVTEAVALANGTATGTLDLCFTPRGRTFFRTNSAAPLVPNTGVVNVAVTRTATGSVRNVSVLPNGMARLAR
jgi:type IV fimbrial biogenesis protein FimT